METAEVRKRMESVTKTIKGKCGKCGIELNFTPFYADTDFVYYPSKTCPNCNTKVVPSLDIIREAELPGIGQSWYHHSSQLYRWLHYILCRIWLCKNKSKCEEWKRWKRIGWKIL